MPLFHSLGKAFGIAFFIMFKLAFTSAFSNSPLADLYKPLFILLPLKVGFVVSPYIGISSPSKKLALDV